MAIGCSRNEILALAGAWQKSRILLSAAELDLFSLLQNGPKQSDELAAEQNWDPRGLRILMDGLVAIGILYKNEAGAYDAKENTLRLLSRGTSESVLPMVLHRGSMWKSWSNITEIVQTGRNPRFEGESRYSDEEMESFIGAMHVVGSELAMKLVEEFPLKSARTMLDIGGGSGVYTIACLNRFPALNATIFDLPDVVRLSKEWINKAGLSERVTFITGDYNKDEFPENHDAVLLSAIIHINSRESNRRLYSKCLRALKTGGIIVVRDHFMNQNRTSPAAGAIFAVNMLAATRAGDTYTVDEVTEDLLASGFHDPKLIRDGREMDQLITAIKR